MLLNACNLWWSVISDQQHSFPAGQSIWGGAAGAFFSVPLVVFCSHLFIYICLSRLTPMLDAPVCVAFVVASPITLLETPAVAAAEWRKQQKTTGLFPSRQLSFRFPMRRFSIFFFVFVFLSATFFPLRNIVRKNEERKIATLFVSLPSSSSSSSVFEGQREGGDRKTERNGRRRWTNINNGPPRAEERFLPFTCPLFC